jgi:DNA-binding PucR family transcriptional regulator
MTALVALDFYSELGVVSIECEGDSLQIIKGEEVSATDHSLDRIGHFLDAIKQKASSFSICKWSHYLRDANEVAHLLARRASSRCFSNVWVEKMPLFISSASFRDFLVSRL